MFRRIGTVLVFMLTVCLLAAGAAAAEGTAAVIDAGDSDRVHLRAGASFTSASKGLYFTGTGVACEGQIDSEWTRVSIGTETGYIFSAYLKTGDAADAVQPRQPDGIVVAPRSTVNFRKGPSLSAGVIRTVPVGTQINVLEKTTDWTKTEIDGVTGYISTWFLKF